MKWEKRYLAAKERVPMVDLESILQKLLCKNIVIIVDKNNKVVSLEGFNIVINEIMSNLDIEDEQTRNNIQEKLSDMLGEKMMRNFFQETSLIPSTDSARYVGETWQVSNMVGDQFNTVVKYTFADLDGDIAEIKGDADITNPKEPVKEHNQQWNELNGAMTARYFVDVKTGMLISSNSELKVKGSMNSMGASIPVTIKMHKKVTVHKFKN